MRNGVRSVAGSFPPPPLTSTTAPSTGTAWTTSARSAGVLTRERTGDGKRCPKCGERKPATTEFFGTRGTDRPGQLQSWCRACSNKNTLAYDRAWPEQKHRRRRTYYVTNASIRQAILASGQQLTLGAPGTLKLCTRCGKEKERTEEFFYRALGTPDGLTCWCRPCHSQSAIRTAQRRRERASV